MIKKKRNIPRDYFYYFILILFIFSLFVPLLLDSNNFKINTPIQIKDFPENVETSEFSKENYNPILEDDKYGLGNITIYNISYNEYTLGFYKDDDLYPLLTQDYTSKNLNLIFEEIKFIETIELAVVNNLDDEIPDNRQISIKLNETLNVSYTNPSEGFLIYRSRLTPSHLLDFYISDNLGTFKLIDGVNYFIDDNSYLIFDYFDYFRKSTNVNFTMHLIWKYDIIIEGWQMTQINENDLTINNQEKNFTGNFNYQFQLNGKLLDNYFTLIPNENFFASLLIYLPDKELLANHSLILNSESVNVNLYLNSEKIINITSSDLFSLNNSEFNLNFTTIFTLKFIDPVYQTWAIDRLVYMRNIRQRIYFPSIISGPSQIFLSSVFIYEPSFTIEQVIKADSLFKRLVTYTLDNISTKIILPYIILGETCPILINYEAEDDLRVVVLDNIKMPIKGLTVKIYYYNQSYGTYISKDQVQLIAPLKTNENGQITIENVPRGNYTAEIYRNGKLIKTTDVNTYVDVNYIYMNILHIPIWIIIFGSINGFILIAGFLFYLRHKRRK